MNIIICVTSIFLIIDPCIEKKGKYIRKYYTMREGVCGILVSGKKKYSDFRVNITEGRKIYYTRN